MHEYEKALAEALKPCLDDRLFRRAVISRRTQAYLQDQTKKLEETPLTIFLLASFKRAKINWLRLNNMLIKILHELENSEVQNAKAKEKS